MRRRSLTTASAVLSSALACALAACRAPQLLPALHYAETASRLGMYDEALAEYALAQAQCQQLEPLRVRIETCRPAFLGEAYVYVKRGLPDVGEAAFAKLTTLELIGDLGMSEAAFRAGWLAKERKAFDTAADFFWYAIRTHPSAPFSGEALRVVVAVTRRTQPRQLIDQLVTDQRGTPGSSLADDMLWWAGDVAREQGAIAETLIYWDALAATYEDSPWKNDAMWFAAKLVAEQTEPAVRTAGDHDDLVARLRAIGETRRVAHLTGSFFTQYLDDAQLLLGRALRDASRGAEAIDAFASLPRLYPDSLLRDDALYELAMTYAQAARLTEACAAMTSLATAFPRSKYLSAPRRLAACPTRSEQP
ncbi:MAG: tetratricopeptide repeat protein [Myxococcales bacterium]|nr:tetratricopeptide repeat protein [Myxococcales bacterium]